MDKTKLSNLRCQLLNNGYTPLPNFDKACYMTNWPRVAVTEDVIKRWGRSRDWTATGLRVEDGLCVIDLDIDHRIIEDVIEEMLWKLPEGITLDRLERGGKGHKLAWFCRADEVFSRITTRRWIAPGEKADDATHSVEVFGGGSPRQFGAFGAHTKDSEGKVVRSYRWAGESPEDVPLEALPVLSKKQIYAMLDAAEAELKRQGFTAVAHTKKGESTPTKVYDLTEDMTFELMDGPAVKLPELTCMVKDGYSGRCSASWLEGPSAVNRTRCLVGKSNAGFVSVWESSTGVSHLPASIKPTDTRELVDRAAERTKEQSDGRRAKLNADDDHISAAAKLLISYAYIPTDSKTPVVPLWPKSGGEAMTIGNFRTLMQPYCGIEVGPNGGEKRINPADVWFANPNRIVAFSPQLRPDRERPTFVEGGHTWLNVYRPPQLGPTAGGNPQGGVDLLAQLVPNKRERAWFTQWLAYKWRNPHIPGPAVVMVARDTFGTGRGTLGRFLEHLFGQRYVKNIDFKSFTGQTYQSQYTDWALNTLITIVNESSASGETPSHKLKNDVYEHLKEVVDPAPTRREYILKGERSVQAVSCMSTFIMTNNPDALPLPENDRRFAVLSNGDTQEPEFWQHINDWMRTQSNIAAFAEWLEGVSLEGYDPYAMPLHTRAKEEMADFSKTALDRLMEEVLDGMEGPFVVEQVTRRMRDQELARRMELPHGWKNAVERMVRKQCFAVKYSSGRSIQPQIGKCRYYVFTTTPDHSGIPTGAPQLRAMIEKNGALGSDNKSVGVQLTAIAGGKT